MGVFRVSKSNFMISEYDPTIELIDNVFSSPSHHVLYLSLRPSSPQDLTSPLYHHTLPTSTRAPNLLHPRQPYYSPNFLRAESSTHPNPPPNRSSHRRYYTTLPSSVSSHSPSLQLLSHTSYPRPPYLLLTSRYLNRSHLPCPHSHTHFAPTDQKLNIQHSTHVVYSHTRFEVKVRIHVHFRFTSYRWVLLCGCIWLHARAIGL